MELTSKSQVRNFQCPPRYQMLKIFGVFNVSRISNSKTLLCISDAPEIEQEETFIHTGEGDETEVICVVHSSPKADVSWFKVRTHKQI